MIPKVIHYLWMSDQKTPEAEECIASWKKQLPDYEIREWNSHNFPYQDFVWTKEAAARKKWAFVTDYFRLWVLYHYGGIYLDADVTVTGSFDQFLHHTFCIGTEAMVRIEAHAIGAEKGHPFIRNCMQYYNNRHFIKDDGSLDMITMPRIITKIFMTAYHYDGVLTHFDGTPLVVKDIVIYPDSFFTLNTYNGLNVCYHNAYGSWRDATTEEAGTPEFVINEYLRHKYFCYTIYQRLKGLKKLIYMLMPVGVHVMRHRRQLQIRNNVEVMSVDMPDAEVRNK